MALGWPEVVLALVNVAQVVLLAWIASRGRRHREYDYATPGEEREE